MIGFYGRGNFGDNVMCSVLTRFLTEDDQTQVTIVSSHPEVQQNLASPQVQVVPRQLRTVISSLWNADILCQGGGTIFHDSYKGKYLARYWLRLVSWALLFWTARVMGVRVIIAGAGIGPIRRRFSRWIIRAAFAACDCIGVRDKASLEVLDGVRVKVPRYLGFDLCALVGSKAGGTASRAPRGQPVLGISGCSLTPFLKDAELNRRYWWALGDALALFAKECPVRIIFFSLFTGTSSESDDTVADLVASRFPKDLIFERRSYDGDAEAVAAHMARCDWFISTKYHGAAAAYLAGCEFAVVTYNQKLAYFADEIGLRRERRIAADGVQPVETWLRVLNSFAEGEQRAGLVSHVEAACRARTGVHAVLEQAYKFLPS